MARRAFRVENRRDMLGKGNRSGFRSDCFVFQREEAAHHGRARHGDALAVHDSVQRIAQIGVLPHFALRHAIDGAAVECLTLPVQHKRLRHMGRPQRFRKRRCPLAHHRKLEPHPLRMLADALVGLVRFGVNAEKGNPARLKSLIERVQARRIAWHRRTAGRKRHEHHRLLRLQSLPLPALAIQIAPLERGEGHGLALIPCPQQEPTQQHRRQSPSHHRPSPAT
ncbi:hypothetical protein HRbin14_01584 [bacterium HR14]|nr:hypothetical protein HRbin14_01584 [bacterium HR14]